ncbi:PIN domain-containing protein [Pseudomonas sp. NBRC 111140]|uniref:PIN domain-containing protein n=1 Tax=Pseudomonas sp. NBRC 111140 TaxID=1661055 RepID=UPI0009EC8347|nr:PIN domain-containing protein [Pseudomonas sp. NBRC 111140]
MTDHYIIDTNVLVQHPEVLAMAAADSIIIPQVVIEELSKRRMRGVPGGVFELVSQAVRKGALISPLGKPQEEPIAPERGTYRLDSADIEIARTAKYYAELLGEDAVCVVTGDHALSNFLRLYRIRSITGAQLLAEHVTAKPDKVIEETAKTIISKQRRYLTLSIFASFITALSGIASTINFHFLVSTISTWGTLISLPILGTALYWYRENFRLSYGLSEFLVGMIMACFVFFPNFDYSSVGATETIQILGGLYVMVRGLDNIGKGAEGTRLERHWKKIFYREPI